MSEELSKVEPKYLVDPGDIDLVQRIQRRESVKLDEHHSWLSGLYEISIISPSHESIRLVESAFYKTQQYLFDKGFIQSKYDFNPGEIIFAVDSDRSYGEEDPETGLILFCNISDKSLHQVAIHEFLHRFQIKLKYKNQLVLGLAHVNPVEIDNINHLSFLIDEMVIEYTAREILGNGEVNFDMNENYDVFVKLFDAICENLPNYWNKKDRPNFFGGDLVNKKRVIDYFQYNAFQSTKFEEVANVLTKVFGNNFLADSINMYNSWRLFRKPQLKNLIVRVQNSCR